MLNSRIDSAEEKISENGRNIWRSYSKQGALRKKNRKLREGKTLGYVWLVSQQEVIETIGSEESLDEIVGIFQAVKRYS